ncbi:MAG: hypothetical protein LBP33_12570 [Candidatus Adiutrix sp.]|jgi:hypothetical protein|nr:hypothetical protein [Candidatus Adiutrix sp.]
MGILEPVLTRVSDEEYNEILRKITEAQRRGDEAAYLEHLIKLPISPGQAAELKRSIGVKGMIEDGLNLSRAVEAYGKEWLSD